MTAQVVVAIASAVGAAAWDAAAWHVGRDPPSTPLNGQTLADAQSLFYNARYEEASALTLALRSADPEDLAVYELRTSALLFQLKAALDSSEDKDKAFKQCAACPALMDAFLADTTGGRSVARARLKASSNDETALFFLGKLDLNYVWLQLGTLGRRTGWDEYWEARRSLDALLKRNPQHVRARVARAWIDYIVDTRMPWGTGWILGGGNKKKALTVVRDAANAEADFFVQAEAEFALWDLHVRERKIVEAVPIARSLAQDFPGNREIARFLETHDPDRRR
jgi:tetratricopeptide (TPR) repeat protein